MVKRWKEVFVIVNLCVLVGCTSTDYMSIDNTGATSKELSSAADRQKSATTRIDMEATRIEVKSKEPAILQSTSSIKEANVDLKDNITVLVNEAKVKDEYVNKFDKLAKEHANLIDKYNSTFRTIAYWLFGIGVILTAAGLFLLIKTAGEFWYAPLIGICLIVVALGAVKIEEHIGKILITIVVVAIILGIRMWIIQQKTTVAAVKVVEQLKTKVPKQVKEHMFGTYNTPGVVAVEQDDTTKKNICRVRKSLHKEWQHIGT